MSVDTTHEFQVISGEVINDVRKATKPVRGSSIGPMFDASQTEFETPIKELSKKEKQKALKPDNKGGAFDF